MTGTFSLRSWIVDFFWSSLMSSFRECTTLTRKPTCSTRQLVEVQWPNFFYRMSVCRTSDPRKPFADDNWPNQFAEFRYSNPDGRNHLPNSSSIFNKSFPHSFLPARAGASVLGKAKYHQDIHITYVFRILTLH